MNTGVIETLTAIVATAVRAPSMHNTQPWRFRLVPGQPDRIEGAVIEVWSDDSRRLPVADPTGWAVRIACGAALLGVRLGVAVLDHRAEVTVLPDPARPALAGLVRVGPRHRATPYERELHAAIGKRRTNRYPFSETPPAPDVPAKLVAAARPDAWLDVLQDPRRRADVAAVVREAQHELSAHPEYTAELSAWVRDAAAGDGVPRETGGPSPEPYDLLAFRHLGTRPRPAGRDFESHPLICVLGTDTDHAAGQIRAGMALHRVLLAGTAAGLASSMLSQPIELPQLRRRLSTAAGRTGGWPQMVLRFGYGVRSPATPRRPVSDVLEIAAVTEVGR